MSDGSKRPRRTVLKTTAGLGLAGLAGCLGAGGDGDGGDGSSGSNSGSGSTGNSSSGSGSGSGSGSVTINWWHAMGGNLGETVKQLASDFSAQSDSITVQTSYKGSYYETLNATTSAIRAGNPPTIAQVVDLGSRLAVDSGQFEAIESVLPDIDWNRYHSPVIDYYSWDGQVQSLPFNSSNPILYYNKDMFAEAGLDPSSPPANLAEIRSASEAIVQNTDAEKGITFANVSWFPEQWFAQANETLVNNGNGRDGDPTEINLDKDVADRIFRWWANMFEDDLYLNAGVGGWGAAQQAFVNQKTGLYISSTAGVAATTEGAAEKGFDLGTAYYPVPGDTRTGVVIGGASLWMTKSVPQEKKEAAAEFFRWLSQPEQQAAWHRGTGYFPITKDAVSLLEEEGWFDENPNFRTAFEQLNDTEVTPATQGFQCGPSSEVRSVIQDGYVSMINSDVEVDAKLEEMKTEADGILQDYIESKG